MRILVCPLLAMLVLLGAAGCPPILPPGGGDKPPVYNNTTDRSNGGASYVGSTTCMACHADLNWDIVGQHLLHGHNYKLNQIQGTPPAYPAEATHAGVPFSPEGTSWFDVPLVIGGFIRKGRYIDTNGYVMTFDADGVDTQWNLAFPPNGTTPGFVPYENSGKFSPENPKPYGFSCFVCHTTGPLSLEENGGMFQDSRPGHEGTWAEAGVQCESCHGPGSNHIPNPEARDLYVDLQGTTCNECHDRPFNNGGSVIAGSGGFVRHHEQYPELKASGAHSRFNCNTCHNPHAGTNYDRENAIIKDCTSCHATQTMALHSGKIYVRGDYTELMSCESCHMPYATKSATGVVVGDSEGRIGDMKTHIFRINADAVDYTGMFTEDGSAVAKDNAGRAAVTLDFICLRCHNTFGGYPFQLTLQSASAISQGIHQAE